MKWMEIAWAQLGVHEEGGPAANAEILAYFHDTGHSYISSDEVAWCAAATGACLERSGIRSTRSLAARSYQTFGTALPVDQLRVGAIGVFKRGSEAWMGHVGFITGWSDDKIKILGGNQADAFNETWISKDKLIAQRWPAAPVTSGDMIKSGSRIAETSTKITKDAALGGALGLSQLWVPPAPKTVDLSWLASQAQSLKGSVQLIEQFALYSWSKWPWIAGVLAFYYAFRVVWNSKIVLKLRTEDHNTGANQGRVVE